MPYRLQSNWNPGRLAKPAGGPIVRSLAAPHEGDDLQAIAVVEAQLGVLRARDHAQVVLHGHARPVQLQPLQQVAERGPGGDVHGFAVDGDLDSRRLGHSAGYFAARAAR